jgi:hypothetical protein
MEWDGGEISIEFEEDENGTIGNLINWFQKRIISQRGLYHGPEYSKIDRILVETENMKGQTVSGYILHNCYFLKASEVTYDYGSNDNVKYQCTFNADWIDSYYPLKLMNPL